MRILLVNVVSGIKSTGRICTDIADKLISEGHEVKIAYGRGTVPEKYKSISVRIGNNFDVLRHALMSKVFDKCGYGSKAATKRFLKWAGEFNPDVLWLHNIHDHYINVFYLFEFIKQRPDMQVKWTQHDCWAFTGGCPYFTMSGCERWKTDCDRCPKRYVFPKYVLFRNPKRNFNRKKAAFTGVKNMELITPSRWLSQLLGESYLKEYSVKVINNTVDTKTFSFTKSDFKKNFGIEDKIMILGVASPWSERKGLNDFIRLGEIISEKYKIVLVGLSKKQIKGLPVGIIGLTKTNSAKELAEIYSAADVFLNLTYEDNYPTVNLEAAACGTPCITYRTGGSPESVKAENVVDAGDITAVLKKITSMFEGNL